MTKNNQESTKILVGIIGFLTGILLMITSFNVHVPYDGILGLLGITSIVLSLVLVLMEGEE